MTFDLVLAGGRVIDGTGSPAIVADVGLRGDRIEAIGELDGVATRERVDVDGLCVTPGFVDVHTHSDLVPFLPDERDDLRQASLRQGVTTEICGNCGFSVFPAPAARRADVLRYVSSVLGADAHVFATMADFRRSASERSLATNLATLVGHGTVRVATMGFAPRLAEPTELRALEAAVDAACADGVVGLSTGLIYQPGAHALTEELVALARVAAAHGLPYVTHLRDEMDGVDGAIDEALQIGAEAGAAVQISHHKTAGKRNFGRTLETLERLERSRRNGLDIAIDVYPYTAGSTNLPALLPPWATEGGVDALLSRLRSSTDRDRIRLDIARGIDGWQRLVGPGEWDVVRVASAPCASEHEGRTIAQIAASSGMDEVDTVAELLLADEGQVTVILEMMAEDDVARVVASPLAMIGSDGIPLPGKPHPRWAGSFVRILGKYVREEGLLTLEQAVHKMTQRPAERFGLRGRGVLAEGASADIVVLDPAQVIDAATYEQPLEPPSGIRHVLVNGVFGVRDGQPTGAHAGRFVTR